LLTRTPVHLQPGEVCALSGGLRTVFCKHKKTAWFIPGVSPIHNCNVHREILVSQQNGLRTCDPTQKNIKREIYEFWPSDILKIFRAAGLARRQIPAFEAKCQISQLADFGQAPTIVSPKPNLEYTLRSSGALKQELPLQAVADGDARKIYWFINDAFIGFSLAGKESLIWNATPGDYTVRAVDELGRSDERQLKVGLAK
jgi:penicillin-binding protein 1C